MKIEFSFQRREMLLFLTTNMAAVTSRANQQLRREMTALCSQHFTSYFALYSEVDTLRF